jgi:hypothetical protein
MKEMKAAKGILVVSRVDADAGAPGLRRPGRTHEDGSGEGARGSRQPEHGMAAAAATFRVANSVASVNGSDRVAPRHATNDPTSEKRRGYECRS